MEAVTFVPMSFVRCNMSLGQFIILLEYESVRRRGHVVNSSDHFLVAIDTAKDRSSRGGLVFRMVLRDGVGSWCMELSSN